MSFLAKILVGFGVLVMLITMMFLMFEEEFLILGSKIVDEFDVQKNYSELRIGLSIRPKKLNPLSNNLVHRAFLGDVFEGVVKIDKNFLIKPGIAVSWGRKSDLEWEFWLRKGVLFHSGREVLVEDLKNSLEIAMSSEDSEVKSFLVSIDKIIVQDEKRILIKTKYPDPLLLVKLALIPIFHIDSEGKYVGTGSYLVDVDKSDEVLLRRNSNYWGDLPLFEKVKMKIIPGKADRVNALSYREIDFLVNVPPDFVQELISRGERVLRIPSLEVVMLMFNVKDKMLGRLNVRKAFQSAIDKKVFLDLTFGMAREVNQFVGSGVFGYNVDILNAGFDLEKAKSLVPELVNTFEVKKIVFLFPESLPLLGDFVKQQLNKIGVEVVLEPLDDAEFIKKLSLEELPFYYLGWRNELGDAQFFLDQVVYSRGKVEGLGQFNANNFSNEEVDKLVDQARVELDARKRRRIISDVLKKIVQEEVIGIPLFESDLVYAYSEKIDFMPRVDGVVLPSEIKIKDSF